MPEVTEGQPDDTLFDDLLQVMTRARIAGGTLIVDDRRYTFTVPWGPEWRDALAAANTHAVPGSSGALHLQLAGSSSPLEYPFTVGAGSKELVLADGSGSGISLDPDAERVPRLGAEPPLGTPFRGEDESSYVLLSRIGSGGTSVVFRSESADLKPVAVKVPSDHRFPLDDVALRRFEREATNLRAIDHPHVLKAITRAWGPQEQPALVTELARESLDDALRRDGPPALNDAVSWLHQILEGLAEVHRRGLLHRDLSAKNVFVMPDSRLVIGDFGTVRHSDDTTLTASGMAMGSFVYLAPEQFENLSATTARSDVYSAGCIAFYVLAGRRPIGPERPLAEREDLPRDIATIVDQMRSHAASGRPEDGGAALHALESVLSANPVPKPSAGTTRNPFGGLSGKDLDRMLMADGWQLRRRTGLAGHYTKEDRSVSVALPKSGGLRSSLVRGIAEQAGIDAVRFAELRKQVLDR